jgi:hypothetical protein
MEMQGGYRAEPIATYTIDGMLVSRLSWYFLVL